MIEKVTEIFNAWKASVNPTEDQQMIAEERMAICMQCEFSRENPILHCGACGCPLKKKVYSPITRACPKEKWPR